jgi:hypothetical protein
VHWLREELGVDHLLWQLDFGGMPLRTARASLDRFIDRVMPQIPHRVADDAEPSTDARHDA